MANEREREREILRLMNYDWKELCENNIPLKKPVVSFQKLIFVILSSI